ncbi:hypothetical protein SK854_35100 [Lentzea sp. BCCO 10_0061]|uniref:Uncharacterized protein n=1 Tax=Lentzea sokolovensis TaxID=3095429 RepID=A0ABU4V6G1_9PSEU|nr:hypothetical protein [Lentzea sp. BCCO 10_0061]MDX8147382.1 hypothetical protein [Lentzea sp. BCCO 10_0061]
MAEKLVRTSYVDVTGQPRQGTPTLRESRVDVERYAQPLAATHASASHRWGVGIGLGVSVAAAGVRIGVGVAVDASGRHISLAAGGMAKLEDQALAPVGETGVLVSTAGVSGALVVTIAWAETFDKAEFQASQTFLMMETPLLRFRPVEGFQDSGTEVVLAQIQVDGVGNVTSLGAQRRRATGIAVDRVEFQGQNVTAAAGTTSVDTRTTATIGVRGDGDLAVSRKVHLPQGVQFTETAGLVPSGDTVDLSGLLRVRAPATPGSTVEIHTPAVGPVVSHIHSGQSGDWVIRSAAAHGNVDIQGNTTLGRVNVGGFLASFTSRIAVGGQQPNFGAVSPDVYVRNDDTFVFPTPIGVFAQTDIGEGVRATSRDGTGLVASGGTRAAVFHGNVEVRGTLIKTSLNFKIDHPADPANRYLSHSAVESDQMKNVYDGVVVLDDAGAAVVELPSWFEPLNTEFRYQLTAVGAAAPNLHVAEEISGGRFTVAGGPAGAKVCWQVTGVRQDAYAMANPLRVETDKQDLERGNYLHPEVYGEPAERNVFDAVAQPAGGET